MKQDYHIIQELCKQLNELSQEPSNHLKKVRWGKHNNLSSDGLPLLWICPDDDGGWAELIPSDSLKCVDDDLKQLEWKLRKELLHAEVFQDDYVFEPAVRFDIPGIYTGYAYGSATQTKAWGIDIQPMAASSNAYHMENYLTEENVEKLLEHEVDFIINDKEWVRLQNLYTQAVDGIIKVEFNLPYSVLVQSLLIELVHLRGLTNLMMDLYDNEDMLNQIMAHMATTKARLLDKLDSNRLLFDNRSNIYTGSGGLGYTGEALKPSKDVKLNDMWGFADAQEFAQVSPDMFLRFAVNHQRLGLNKFGRACYGCCEPMDGKYDAIFSAIPNLTRISVSPWSNWDEAAESIGKRAVFSWKPNPSKVCIDYDQEGIANDLKKIKQITENNCHLEIILKDIRTINASPQNLIRFVNQVKGVWG